MLPSQPFDPEHTQQISTQACAAPTEQQWEEEAMLKLRAENDRMDALAAAATTTATEYKFIVIDGLLYAKAWLVDEETQSCEARTHSQA